MKQILDIGLRQTLAMTPQLQQAIRLLQLSAVELQTEVQEAIETNYMLEQVDGEGGDGEEGRLPDGASAAQEGGAGTALDAPPASSEPEEAAPVEPVDIPRDLPVDSAWEDIYDAVPGAGGSGGEYNGTEPEFQRSGGETLQDHLRWQMELTHFSPLDRLIAEAIVDGIGPDGYLVPDLEEILESVRALAGELAPAVGMEEIEAVLHQIQNFDPPGVGARTLSECLMLQLRELPGDMPERELALALARDYLPLWASRDFTGLQRKLGVDKETLHAVLDLIQSLNPRPGSQVGDAAPEYVIPDVIVTCRNGRWHVELNPEALPRVRVNPHYASLVRRGEESAQNDSLRRNLNEAKWFIKSLQSRAETLLKVATCIVERQQGFLEHGEEAMKPMVLHDIAEAVGMHESTISRVTSRKYMHTPRGIYELKYFFSSQVATDSGEGASSTAIRAHIRKLVAGEDPGKPLSDSKLAALLKEQGFNVARRTVAKYRESIGIPASSERRKLV